MVQKQSYQTHLKLKKAEYERLQNHSNQLKNKIIARQNAIYKSVKNKQQLQKQLSIRPYTRQQMQYHNKINQINQNNTKRGRYIHKNRNKLNKTYQNIKNVKYQIRQPRVSSLSATSKNGYFIRNKIFPLIFINNDNILEIVAIIVQKYFDTLELLANKRKKYKLNINDNTIKNIKLVFSDEFGDFVSSVNITSLDQIEEKLRLECNKHNPDSQKWTKKYKKIIHPTDPNRYLMAVDFFIFNTNKKVGCSSNTKPKFVLPLSPNELIRLYCPKTSNNRCFDMCLIKAKQIINQNNNNKKLNPYSIRKKLNIPTDTRINPKSNHAHQIADLLNISYRVWLGIINPNRNINDPFHKSLKLYSKYGNINDPNTADIVLLAGHSFLAIDKNVYKLKCNNCGDTRKFGIETTHKCNNTRVSYYKNKICKQNTLKITNLRKDKHKKWVFFDLETLPCGKGETHNVYAVGWYDFQNNKYYYQYGKQSMQNFMKWIHNNPGNKYIAYNGAKFDFYFLQSSLIKQNIKTNYLNSYGRLLSLKWGGSLTKNKKYLANQNTCWDIYQFMPGFSLKSACQAFETTHQKLDFDHSKIKNWTDVQTHKNEVLKYLKYDVMSLKELTEKYVAVSEELFDASPTQYLTLSSYAENVWKSNLDGDDVIEIPDMQKQHFIGRSVYGGRTYPSQKRFKSHLFDKIQNNKTNKNELKKIYTQLAKSNDYIFNGDINSQYPSCMAGIDLMPTLYPTGTSSWINNDPSSCSNTFYNTNKLGVFEISFQCPNKQIKHPILPRKKIITQKSGKQIFAGVEWSLTDGKGVYNTIDIQNALKHGYKIKFTGNALVWEGVSNKIFKIYVDLVYNLKVNATKENNKVKRQIAKLMMNSLYGKTLQNPINTSEEICKNMEEIEMFVSQHIITYWDIVENDNNNVDYVILVGEKINNENITKKPRQLGSFILSYSRRLWLLFLENIDPTLTSNITSYQDTDSMHIHGKHHNLLRNKNLIHSTKLGYLSNDCDNDAFIFYEINLAPKCYCYLSLDKDGQIKTTMKSKGIMQNLLKQEWFENETPAPVEWTGLKKINKRISNKDRANGVTHFSIKQQHYTRTFYKNEWTGMKYTDNYYLPFGHE